MVWCGVVCCVLCVLWCCGVVWCVGGCVFKIFVGASKICLPSLSDLPPSDRPKCRAFFLSHHKFHSFFPLSGGLLVEFWWCLFAGTLRCARLGSPNVRISGPLRFKYQKTPTHPVRSATTYKRSASTALAGTHNPVGALQELILFLNHVPFFFLRTHKVRSSQYKESRMRTTPAASGSSPGLTEFPHDLRRGGSGTVASESSSDFQQGHPERPCAATCQCSAPPVQLRSSSLSLEGNWFCSCFRFGQLAQEHSSF